MREEPERYRPLEYLQNTKVRLFTNKLKTRVGRRLVSHALQGAIRTRDLAAVNELVVYIKNEQIMVHIKPSDVKFLIMEQEHAIILTLLHYNIQVRLQLQ